MDKETTQDIEQYIHAVTAIYNVDEIYLFGSYAKGRNHQHSDLDLAIISEEADKDRHAFLVDLIRLKRNLTTLVEPHPMTAEDLNDPYYPLGKEVRRHGIRLYPSHGESVSSQAETNSILRDKNLMDQIESGQQDVQTGNVYPLNQVRDEILT